MLLTVQPWKFTEIGETRHSDDLQDTQIFVLHTNNMIIKMFILLTVFQTFFAWSTQCERQK
jgi:hypothetical protein